MGRGREGGGGGGGGGRGATENLNLLCGSEKLACDVYSKLRVCVTGYRDVFDLPVISRFYTRDVLCVWTNLGSVLLFVWLCVCSIKTATRRIMRLDGLCSVIRLNRRTIDHSSSRRIMRVCV